MARGAMVVVVLLQLHLLAANGADSTAVNTLPDCPGECGNVSIPYPFGIGMNGKGKDCFGRTDFQIICNATTTPAEAYLARSNKVVVTNISVLYGEVRLLGSVGTDCFYPNLTGEKASKSMDLSELAFTFSATRNKFTALGCDTLGLVGGKRGVFYTGGCISYCDGIRGMANGTCSGLGCCQTPIPKGLRMYNATVASFNKHRNGWDDGQFCGYAFLVEEDQYQFQIPDLNDTNFGQRQFPVVLDWSIGNSSCGPQLGQSQEEYECRSKNSECVNSTRGVGYVCNCTKGYEGNPYLENGCRDINECEHPELYPCNGRCKNTDGSYKCTNTRLQLALGLGFGLIFLLILVLFALWALQQRRLKKMKLALFERNGGELLKQIIRTSAGSNFRLYTEEELKRAVARVSPDKRVLGEGREETVRKGVLSEGNQAVAIKKYNMFDERRSQDFVKEIITLSQIDHMNVVKLLGCCLDVERPMLVYEFIPGGDLSHLLHERDHRDPISLDTRLSIALDVADALKCLHSYEPTPIFHGDIKSSNILLDENKTAKVSDFTASKLGPKDKKQLATRVTGSCGYMDPEYFVTNHLTEKSDVYSFGVVLVELLTRKEPIVFEGPEEQRSLASHFVSSVAHNRLMGILDAEVARERDRERLRSIANLACQCLKIKGEDRPTMEVVFMTLTDIARAPRA